MERLSGVETCRGAAALLVVFYHAAVYLRFSEEFRYQVFSDVFGFGGHGVDFFFVLSGFIILFAYGKDLGRLDRLPHYAWHRFTRLYPIYWCVCAIVIPILFAYPTVRFAYGHETRWDVILKSLVLFPQERPPVVGVAWTLQHEVLFYVLFGALYVHRAVGWILLLGWQALVLGVNLGRVSVTFPMTFLSDMHNFQFLIGMALVPVVRRVTLRHPLGVLAVGTLLFLACGILEMHGPLASPRAFVPRCLTYGLASALILWGLVQAEVAGKVRIPAPLVAIGVASYSIYLIHIMVIHALAQGIVLFSLERWLPEVVTFAALSGGCVVAGMLLSRYVERPLLRSLRNLTVCH